MVHHNGISIYYMPTDGEQWANYTSEKLNSKEYGFKCVLNEFSCDKTFHVSSTTVNVFFITPDFLDYKNWELMHQFNKDTCIIVLTGVDSCDLEQVATSYKCEHVLQWCIHEIEKSDDSVRDMIVAIIGIYESTDPLPNIDPSTGTLPRVSQVPHEPDYMNPSHPDDSDIGGEYDTLPPVRRQVNRVEAVFSKDGVTHMVLERRAESPLQVELDGNSIEPDTTDYAVYILPQYTGRPPSTVTVFQDNDVIGKHDVKQFDSFDAHLNEAQTRLSAMCKTTKDCCTQTEAVAVQTEAVADKTGAVADQTNTTEDDSQRDTTYMNLADVKRDERLKSDVQSDSQTLSKLTKLDQIRQLLQDEIDPVQILCQCLQIEKNIQRLDEKLSSLVECIETLQQLSVPNKWEIRAGSPKSTWPTLIHFGARFNLVKFCDTLLCNPLMYDACTVKNKNGHLPHEIARENGHNDLAERLEHFTAYVRNSGVSKYDSGLSGVGTPRLSTITMMGDIPPAPHMSFIVNPGGYMPMNNKSESEDSGGTMVRESGPPSDPFANIMEFRGHDNVDSPTNPTEPTIFGGISVECMDEEDSVNYRNKDLRLSTTSPEHDGKKKGFFNKFFKRRGSNSETVETRSSSIKSKKKDPKVYRRADSARSSGTSSSTGSVISEASNKEEEHPQVQLRGKKKKSKDKEQLKNIINTAKRRQSVRIKHALKDQNLTAPTLPERKPHHVFTLPDL